MNVKLISTLVMAVLGGVALVTYKAANAQDSVQPSVSVNTPRSSDPKDLVRHCTGCVHWVPRNPDDDIMIDPSRYWRGSLPVPDGMMWVPAVYPRSNSRFEITRDEEFEKRCERNIADNMRLAGAAYPYHSSSGSCACGWDHSTGRGPQTQAGGIGDTGARKAREEARLRNMIAALDTRSEAARKRAAEEEVRQLREDYKSLKNIDLIELQDFEEYTRFIEARTSGRMKEYDRVQRWVCESCAQTRNGGTKKAPKAPGKLGCLMSEEHAWTKM